VKGRDLLEAVKKNPPSFLRNATPFIKGVLLIIINYEKT